MILLVVIVDWMVIFVVQVHFQMTKTKHLMREMASFESSSVVWVVFLPRVLRVVAAPVEQSVRLMIVMIVHMFQVGDDQFACGVHFVLRWVME